MLRVVVEADRRDRRVFGDAGDREAFRSSVRVAMGGGAEALAAAAEADAGQLWDELCRTVRDM